MTELVRMRLHPIVLTALLVIATGGPAAACSVTPAGNDAAMSAFVDKLLARMNVEEKVGQLSIMGADTKNLPELIRNGLGGTNGVLPADEDVYAHTRRMQQLAMQSRLKIPLWFMGDVNHGFRTVFPVPLALAASWDTNLVERVHRMAATEATAAGVNWTFSPMVDITRDARWGRVVEGAGEDPYLGAAMALAQLRGFRGNGLAASDSMMSTAKHFVGYGAAEAGRDYNPSWLPPDQLHDVYLPPFKALSDAGIGSIMPSLTTLNGVPATSDGPLLNGLLRQHWGYRGLVVSDFDAVAELQQHGVAASPADAARQALAAGVDVDLHSGIYQAQLRRLMEQGRVPMGQLDAAVRRVLEAKYRLGLFADPFRYGRASEAAQAELAASHRALAKQAAIESMVLLKNVHQTLPLAAGKRLAVIGPLADDARAMLGQMPAHGRPQDVITVLSGLRQAFGDRSVSYSAGVSVSGDDTSGIDAAVKAARAADVAVLVLGEDQTLFGEGLSRSQIGLPGHQLELAKAIAAIGKPVVVVLVNGRPLTISWLHDHASAILEAWVPGVEAGSAVADLLLGKANPSGKLPMTFPRDVGQTPLYYAHLQTGRAYDSTTALSRHYTSHYVDVANTPLYRFGYGLSYTRFSYGPVTVNGDHLDANGSLQVSVRLTNSGPRRGTEVAQLYVHDKIASLSPPVRLLKGFKRVTLDAGASTKLNFTLEPADLAFYRADGSIGTEPGAYELYVGGDSSANHSAEFTLDAASAAD